MVAWAGGTARRDLRRQALPLMHLHGGLPCYRGGRALAEAAAGRRRRTGKVCKVAAVHWATDF
jgi:hypothetical protein